MLFIKALSIAQQAQPETRAHGILQRSVDFLRKAGPGGRFLRTGNVFANARAAAQRFSAQGEFLSLQRYLCSFTMRRANLYDLSRTIFSLTGSSRADVVRLDLAVERGVVHAKQTGGAALMTAGHFKSAFDQFDLKA